MGWRMADYPRWIWFELESKIHYIDEVMAVYRTLPESASHSKEYNKRLAFIESSHDIKMFFAEKYSLGDGVKIQIDDAYWREKSIVLKTDLVTYEQIEQYYNSTGLKICVTTSELSNAESHTYLITTDDSDYSDNIKKMFLAGMLRIESMGIKYIDIYSNFSGLLRWDSGVVNEVWDAGVWAE